METARAPKRPLTWLLSEMPPTLNRNVVPPDRGATPGPSGEAEEEEGRTSWGRGCPDTLLVGRPAKT
eukprot:12817453-Alexandrium_andersonii.AAC.1